PCRQGLLRRVVEPDAEPAAARPAVRASPTAARTPFAEAPLPGSGAARPAPAGAKSGAPAAGPRSTRRPRSASTSSVTPPAGSSAATTWATRPSAAAAAPIGLTGLIGGILVGAPRQRVRPELGL